MQKSMLAKTQETDVIDENGKAIETKIDDVNNECIEIIHATPLTMTTVDYKDDSKILTLSLLCRTIDEELITVCMNYVAENETEVDMLEETIPFHDSHFFTSVKIANNMILNSLRSFVTDMDFLLPDENPDKCEYILLPISTIGENKERLNLKMSLEIFSSIKYIDEYICNYYTNKHDLTLATITGINPSNKISMFNVTNIDYIVSLAPTGKNTSTVAVMFRAQRLVDGNSEAVSILVPFDIGVVYKKTKFKGNTSESLQQNFLKEFDQYLALYTFRSTFNSDKDYLIIKGKNNNGDINLFMLDSNVTKRLTDLIEDY